MVIGRLSDVRAHHSNRDALASYWQRCTGRRVTSQIVGKFKNVNQCKTAASQPITGGTISDLSLLVLCVHGPEVISPNRAARLG